MFGKLWINFAFHTASVDGEAAKMSVKEVEILRYLWERKNQVVSRHDLLADVWGYEETPTTRTVDNFILRLRQKIETDPNKPLIILTVHGLGYRLVAPEEERQLAAIMFTDIVGYTALMGEDEQKAFRLLKKNRQVQRPIIEGFNGRWLKEIGDGVLASFNAVSDAVYCAKAIQEACLMEDDLKLRIGIHQGEVVFEGDDVFGDGVNIASRLEPLAPIGGILVSESVYRNIENKKGIEAEFVKEETLKNVKHPVKIYEIKGEENSRTAGSFLSKSSTKATSKVLDRSIAVLPFVNMSSETEQEFFSDGISEEIINTIVQLPELKVVGRASSFSFKGLNEDLRTVGQKLGVSKILEGSVRKSGNQVRITAQLVEASTGFHLWSKKYDRELVDVFAIQDEIALDIASHLKITFTGDIEAPKARKQTQSIDAYQLYFKGRSLYYERGVSLFEALKCFQDALDIDPTYALASSGLADTYIMLVWHGHLPPNEAWPNALAVAQRALKYGADLAEIHNTWACLFLLHDREWKAAEREFKKALDLNPGYTQARCWYGYFYLMLVRRPFEQGIEHTKLAIENDPLSSYAYCVHALALCTSDLLEESIISASNGVKLNPDGLLGHYALGYCYLWAGKLNDAIRELQIALSISSGHSFCLCALALSYLKSNKREDALELYREMEDRLRDNYMQPSALALVAAALGKKDDALKFAHQALDIIDPYLLVAISSKESEALESVPGFDEILKRFG